MCTQSLIRAFLAADAAFLPRILGQQRTQVNAQAKVERRLALLWAR